MLLGRGMATISLFCSPRKRVMALFLRTVLCGSVAMRALLRGRNFCVPISVQLCSAPFVDQRLWCVYRAVIGLWRPVMITFAITLVGMSHSEFSMGRGSS